MMQNRYIIACAGSGKTTTIIRSALNEPLSHKILITTFTDENCDEIKRKFVKEKGFIPGNVDILPWFTFQLKHLIKPYQPSFIDIKIQGVCMVPNQSAPYTSQNSKAHYIGTNNSIYSDKIALLSYNTIIAKKKQVFGRLKEIYDSIYVDEFQDFAGYDLEIIKEFMKQDIPTIIVGDPRQKTYSTHFSKKNSKYNDDKEGYIKNECLKLCEVDTTTLNNSHRCPEKTINYASKLFPMYPASHSDASNKESDGIYLVDCKDIVLFIENEKNVVQLRFNAKTHTTPNHKVITYGKSKGSTFENVLIYPTSAIKKAVLEDDFTKITSPLTLCKFYVALTRAMHKVGIVVDTKDILNMNKKNDSISMWKL